MNWIGNVPDWLQAVAAVAGLFAGGAGGTAYGGILRHRLEDRRSMYQQTKAYERSLMIALATAIQRGLVGVPMPDVPSWYITGQNTVALLPWADRAEFQLLRDTAQELRGTPPMDDARTLINEYRTQLAKYSAHNLDYLNPVWGSRLRRWRGKARLVRSGLHPFNPEVRRIRDGTLRDV